MSKNLLPWVAIAAIVITLFLLSEFPGREASGLRPAEAWKQGVHLLTTEDEEAARKAAELLEQSTSFEAPEDLPTETVEMLRNHEAADEATGRLQQALLDAAERRLAGEG
jgi:hypothetical protein